MELRERMEEVVTAVWGDANADVEGAINTLVGLAHAHAHEAVDALKEVQQDGLVRLDGTLEKWEAPGGKRLKLTVEVRNSVENKIALSMMDGTAVVLTGTQTDIEAMRHEPEPVESTASEIDPAQMDIEDVLTTDGETTDSETTDGEAETTDPDTTDGEPAPPITDADMPPCPDLDIEKLF